MAVSTNTERVRFGAFEFNLATGELSKHGTRIRLQEQPAHILRVLISRHGELVSREELQHELWPSGVFTDYEHGLHRAVNRIRAALGDSAANPCYLETEAKRGYRFIAPVQPIVRSPASDPLSNEKSVQAERPVDQGALKIEPAFVPARNPNWRRSAGRIAGLSAMLALLLGIVPFVFSRGERRVTRFQRRDLVLVTRFNNRTGEPLLDGTLDFTLARELSESEFVGVASPQRIYDVLRLMRRPVDTPLTGEIAREICLRDPGIRAFVTGSVDKIGSRYVLSAEIVDPVSGQPIRTFAEQASTPSQLLPALHRLSDNVRTTLGDDLPRASTHDQPLQKVTTSSIDALKLYSEAVQHIEDGSFDGDPNRVIGLLTKAVQLDPQFASAQIQLGDALLWSGQRVAAAEHFQAALRLTSTVPDRERWFIQAEYYDHYQPDEDKAVIADEELLRLHPDDVAALRRLLFITGEASLGYRAADLRPNNLGINAWAWVLAVETRNLAMEARYYQRSTALLSPDALEDSPGAGVVEFARAIEAVDRGDLPRAEAELKKIGASIPTLGPKASGAMAFYLANFYCYLGQLKEAERWLALGAARLEERGRAQIAYARGDPSAIAKLKRIAAWPSPEPNVTALLVTLGDTSGVQNALRAGLGPIYRNTLDGAEAIARGDRQDAAVRLRRALDRAFYADQKLAAANLLARVLEQEGDFAGAADVLTVATSSRLLPAVNLTTWAIETRLHLARVCRKLGRDADAERIEQTLRVLLAHADPDFVPAKELRAVRVRIPPR